MLPHYKSYVLQEETGVTRKKPAVFGSQTRGTLFACGTSEVRAGVPVAGGQVRNGK